MTDPLVDAIDRALDAMDFPRRPPELEPCSPEIARSMRRTIVRHARELVALCTLARRLGLRSKNWLDNEARAKAALAIIAEHDLIHGSPDADEPPLLRLRATRH